MILDITEFGAVADGKTLTTDAIQNALDKCAAAGGGIVNVPAGEYKTGTIYLRSNVELHLEHGSKLIASDNLDDYNPPDAYPQNWSSDYEQWNKCHLILGIEISNAAITGSGTVDGNAEAFFTQSHTFRGDFGWRYGLRMARDKQLLRPGQMVIFVESKDIAVSGIRMQNSTCWTLTFHGCENVRIHGLDIKNKRYHGNTDGIDIDSSRNVVISDCIIDTGDDALTLRGDNMKLLDQSKVCENVTITNCVLASGVCGMRIGVGKGTIRNISISNLSISECGIPFHIQSIYHKNNDVGVKISDLRFSNITCAECTIPILIESGSDLNTAFIKNISFSNCSFYCSHSMLMNGGGKCIPENIIFSNIDFFVINPVFKLLANPKPEHFFCLNNAKNVIMDSVRIHWMTTEENWQDCLLLNNVENLIMNNCSLPDRK